MMRKPFYSGRLPTIIVSEDECHHLMSLAEKGARSAPDAAGMLEAEMKRAVVLPADKVPPLVIRMGSTIEFSFDAGQPCEASLVYPERANGVAGRISVLTPIGAALIGLAEGQTFAWKGIDGRVHKVTVLRVAPIAPASGSDSRKNPTVVAFSPRPKSTTGRSSLDPDDDDPGPRAA